MSKKYFVEGKGYITISLEEEPIFLSEYRNAVEVKPKETEVKASVPAMSALPKKIDLLKTSSDVESLQQPLGNGKTTQFNARLKAEQDAELEVAKTNVRRREAVEAQYGNLARDFGDNSPQAQKQLAELRKYDDMVDPQNIKTPIARDYLMQYHKDRNTQIWSTRLQNLAKTQAELASQKDASPDWNKRYNEINKEIAHANELYRYYASGMTDAEAGLVRAGEQISNSFGNTWTGIVPRAFISFGSGAVDMLYSPMALGGVLAGGQGGLANQRFVSQGLSTETGNILSDLLQQTAYSAPMTIATMANPALGAALTFSNIIEANMNDVAVKYGGWDKAPRGTQTAAITSGIISGAIEYGSNLIQIGVVRKLSAARTPASFANAKNYIKSTITGKGRALNFAKAMGIDGVVEGTEEYVDSMSSDLLNNALGETNYTMAEMVAHANKAFIGGAFGGLTFGLFGGGYHSFQARSQWKTTEALAKANNPTAKTVMQIVTELKKDSPDVQVVNAKAETLMQAKSEGIKNKKLEMAVANILDSVYANGLYSSSYEEMQRQFPDNEQINSFDVVMLKQGIYEVYQELNKLTSGKPNQKNQTKERIATTLKAIAQEISFGHNDRALQLLSQMQVQNLGNIQADPEMSGFYQSASKIIGKLTRYATQGKQASDAYASLRGNQIEQNRVVDISPAPEIAPQKAETQPWEQPKQEAPLETSVIFAEAYKVDKNQKATPEQITETLTRIDQVMQSDAPDTMKKVLGEIRDRLTARLTEPTETKEEKPPKDTKEVKPVKPVEPVTAGQTKVIHIKKNQIELSDEAYRAEVKAVSKGRTETSKELTYAEAQALINRLNKMEKPKKQAPKKAEPKPKATVEKPKKAEPAPVQTEEVKPDVVVEKDETLPIDKSEAPSQTDLLKQKAAMEKKKLALEKKIDTLEERIDSWQDKDKDTADLEDKLSDLESDLDELETELDDLDDKIAEKPEPVAETPAQETPELNVYSPSARMNSGSKLRAEKIARLYKLETLQSEGAKKVKVGSAVMSIETAIKKTEASIDDKTLSEYRNRKTPTETKPETKPINTKQYYTPELGVEYGIRLGKEKIVKKYRDKYAESDKSEETKKRLNEMAWEEIKQLEGSVKAESEKIHLQNVRAFEEHPAEMMNEILQARAAGGGRGYSFLMSGIADIKVKRQKGKGQLVGKGTIGEQTINNFDVTVSVGNISKTYVLTGNASTRWGKEQLEESAAGDFVADILSEYAPTETKPEQTEITDRKSFQKRYREAQPQLSKEQIDAQLQAYDAMFETYSKAMGISLDDAYKTFQISNLDPKENSLSQAERDDIAEAEAQMEAVRKQYQAKASMPVITDSRGNAADGVGYHMGFREASYKGKLFHKAGWEALGMVREREYKDRSPSYSTEQSTRLMNAFGSDLVLILKVDTNGEYYQADAGSGRYMGYDEFVVDMPHDKFIQSIDKIIVSKALYETIGKLDDIDVTNEEIGLDEDDRMFMSSLVGYESPIHERIVPSTESGYSPEFLNFDDGSGDSSAKAQYKDTYLKAPNGKPSNLNERQWLQVRTPNFLNWFGDWENDPKNASKVIDENGEPMVVYHGGKFSTDTGIPDVVGRQRKNWQLSFGMHFSESIEEAKDYQKMSKGSLTEVFLNLRNPLYAEPTQNEHGESQFHSIDKALYESMPTNLRKVYDKQYGNALKETKTGYGYTEWMENSLEKLSPQEAKMALEEMGFDGVKYLARANMGLGRFRGFDSYIAFSPTQIKSATANVGTFDPENADIRYQEEMQRFPEQPVMDRDYPMENFSTVIQDFAEKMRKWESEVMEWANDMPDVIPFKTSWGYEVVSKDTTKQDKNMPWRVTSFNTEHEPLGHAIYPTKGKAVVVAVKPLGHYYDPSVLFQKQTQGVVRGYLTTLPNGNMIIGFLNPDFSTGLHEQAHIGEVFLKSMAKTDPKWKQVLGWAEEWLGVEKGKWTVENSEKFAQGYEKFLLEGKAPNSKMQAVFNQIKAWMNAVANKVKELAGIELTDQMRQVYSALLGGEIVKPTLTKAQKVQAVEIKENLKLKESTSVNEFAHEMEVLIGKFNNLTLSQPRAGKFSITNVDIGKVILEITSKDGFEINGTAYTNVYDALVAVTDLLGENTASNSVTLKQVAETTLDPTETEKAAKRREASEKVIRSQYQKVAEAIENYGIKTEKGQPIGLPAWRNALISAVDTILHEQIGVSKLTADKLKRISEQTVKPETVKRWLEDERRYREVMQMYSGYDNSSKIPTIQLFTMMAQLSPHYYKSMTANTTIENLITLYNKVKDEIEGDPEQFLEGMLYLTMTQGNIASSPMGEFTTWLAQPVKVLLSLFGTAGKRLYGHVQEGTLTRARIQEKAAPSQKIILRTLATSENDANRKYTPAERKEIGRILVSIASNEDLTAKEKPDAMLAFVDSYNLKNSENPISEKDVLEIYYAVLDIVNMVQGEIEKLNSNMGEWVIGIRKNYFPRTLISINKMFEAPLNEEEVQLGKPAYAEERELKQPDMSKLSVDLLKDIDHYVSSMSRYIAFYPVKEYYTKRFKQEIPANMKVHEGKSAMDYARDYVNTAMGKYKVRGKLEDVISIARTNVYAATLATSSALTVQNMAQKLLIMTVVPPKVYRAVMRDTNVATGKPINRKEMPMLSLLLDVLNNANPNQMHEYRRELQDISKDDESALIRFYAKWSKNISENSLQYSPFGLAEKGNWGYGYVAGTYVVCMKSKPYQEARADGKAHREAIEIALSNPKVMQAAMMGAGYVNAKVNADPSLLFSPQVYGTFAGRQLYYIKYFHNFTIIAKEIIFFQGIASKWSRELFDQTLYSTNGEDAVSDRIRSLNMMIKDLDPKRLAKMERETHDLREANLPLSDMVKMHGALIDLRDELVTGMRKQERLLKSGRLIQADAAAGLLGFMLADYLIIMIIRYLKSRRHKYFAEKHYLGDRKTSRIMKQEDIDPLTDAFKETQIPRLTSGVGLWQGLYPEIETTKGWKTFSKESANWTAKTLPLVNILNNLSLEIFGDTGTNIMIDKISEQ